MVTRRALRDQLASRSRELALAQRALAADWFAGPTSPRLESCPDGDRLLVFAPHPDDDIIGCGGVLLNAVEAGREVQVVYVTDGTAPRLQGDERRRVIAERYEEAERVWRSLGGNSPIFWDITCRRLPVDGDTSARFTAAIDDFRPDCIFTPFFLEDPEDHRKISQLLWLAHQRRPLPDIEVWSYQVTAMVRPNVVVDITEVEHRKNDLMRMWVSQNKVFDYAHRARGLAAANSRYLPAVPDGRAGLHAELFFVLRAAQFADVMSKYMTDAAEGALRP